MVYLKIQNPDGDGSFLAAATPHNMFAFCSICGTQIHLRQSDVIINPSLWGPNYKCSKCRKAMEELEAQQKAMSLRNASENDGPDEDDNLFCVTDEEDDTSDVCHCGKSNCGQCSSGCGGHCESCSCHSRQSPTSEDE